MPYSELKNNGVTSTTPQNILFGAGTIHKGFKKGYYAECASGDSGALEVISDEGTIVGDQIKLATALVDVADIEVGDYVLLVDEWNFDASLIGATSGGNKLTITPNLKDIELDGVDVKVKGLTVKTGETAKFEVNFAELTAEIMQMATLGTSQASVDVSGYTEIVSKSQIEAGDYVSKLAFVGKKLDGTPIIIILDEALCTSGLEVDGKNQENGVIKMTFECYAEIDGDLSKLPYHIYYPTPAA